MLAVHSLEQFNSLSDAQAQTVLATFCKSEPWQEAMLAGRPYETVQSMVTMGLDLWSLTDASSIADALSKERILGNRQRLAQLFTEATAADQQAIKDIEDLNGQYEAKFGFPFVCSVTPMVPATVLDALKGRVLNHRGEELDKAASELALLFTRRIQQSIHEQEPNLSIAVVDTATGMPVKGMALALFDAQGRKLAACKTNDTGRVDNWGKPIRVEAGEYWLKFDTRGYYESQGQVCFHPSISIHFAVSEDIENYHVPLWLSPFGYSTCRS